MKIIPTVTKTQFRCKKAQRVSTFEERAQPGPPQALLQGNIFYRQESFVGFCPVRDLNQQPLGPLDCMTSPQHVVLATYTLYTVCIVGHLRPIL